ncbi:MAG TPA: biotin--[acetyl-CoA-carboxylase] ligase [Gemmatimonadaceae bacterium]|nr:biotin--[acetyl-CoA-carboxylase] ligase [Gemmatimonadaceae bacterium]
MSAAVRVESSGSWDGMEAVEIAAALRLPGVVAVDSTPSTLDLAHALAADGAPSGTLVLADEQTSGRGRGGKRWTSEPGQGIWLTLVERAVDPGMPGVLALRLGIAAAEALEPLAPATIRVKWPNDLWIGDGKLAGILAEARWRDGVVEWVAVGMGVNVRPPRGVPNASGLRGGVPRLAALARLVPALRDAAARRGALDARELALLEARDLARGREIREPAPGRVEGISGEGALLVRASDGTVSAQRAGSLVFTEDA